MCSFHDFLDRVLFHHDFHPDSCEYYWDLGGLFFSFWTTRLGFVYVMSVLEYSTGELYALQLIVLMVFDVVD